MIKIIFAFATLPLSFLHLSLPFTFPSLFLHSLIPHHYFHNLFFFVSPFLSPSPSLFLSFFLSLISSLSPSLPRSFSLFLTLCFFFSTSSPHSFSLRLPLSVSLLKGDLGYPHRGFPQPVEDAILKGTHTPLNCDCYCYRDLDWIGLVVLTGLLSRDSTSLAPLLATVTVTLTVTV